MLNFWWKKKASFRIRNDAKGVRAHGPVATFFLWTGMCMLALWFVYPRALTWFFVQAAMPFGFVYAWYETSTHAAPSYFRGVNELRVERDRLQEELAARDTEKGQYVALVEENNKLRNLSGDDTSYRIAGVLLAPPLAPHDILVLDQGADDGLAVGMQVFAENDRALGVVQTVYDDRVIVQLFSSPQALTTVYVPSIGLFTAAEGVGGGTIRVHVPQDLALAVGAQVVLPGIHSWRIGAVSYIESKPTNPEQSAYITTVAPHTYQFVRVDMSPRIVPSFDELRAILREYNATQLGDITLPTTYVKNIITSSSTSSSTGTNTPSTTNE